jgi:hypothetical protein
VFPETFVVGERAVQERTIVMTKYLLAGALLLAFATPTLAAKQFYIIRGADKQCTVVEEKPTSSSTTVIVGNKAYTTREEAETELKTVCAG